jgi:hypothetical protein
MQTAACRTVMFNLPWDDAPIDLRHLFADENPAGKHGFLTCRKARMVFEDGTEARFWGTNFNSAANFPSHSYSEKVARRLAKFGVNLVRFHQLDGDWSTPNIFQFTKGRRLDNTRALDPESMDRLDYLIFCLKQEGIYVYFDMLTYRLFRSGDGVAAAEQLRNSGRPYSNFDPRMIELQKEFCTQVWTHVNPYTKLAYKDDPVIALTEITNENEMFGTIATLIEPYRSQLETRYLDWLKARGLPPVARPIAFEQFDAHVTAFVVELQKTYFRDMQRHMIDLGVKIPITGTNWAVGGAATLESQRELPFMDSHTYFYNWGWKPYEKRVHPDSMLGSLDSWYRGLAFMRVLDRPFFVSEWDEPWPNEWRAECVLNLAAVSALQGWSGTAIHTYRYDCRETSDMIALPITSDALAGIPYRGGVFDTFNDPAKFGLFYHAAIILRRGDVKESTQAMEAVLPGLRLADNPATAGQPGLIGTGQCLPLCGTCEVGKIGVRLPGAPALAPRQLGLSERVVPEDATELRSDTGELYRNIKQRFATIDTPRTKAAYGFLGAVGPLQLTGLRLRCRTDFAVIALSSLTDAPLDRSDNILLTAVGRADNTGATYNSNRTLQYSKGHGPILAEVIEVEIELDTTVTGLKISGINSEGMICGPVAEKLENGKLTFSLGGDFPTLYYLIQKL